MGHVDVLMAAVNEGDDERVQHPPLPGRGIQHETEPTEVDLGDLAGCHVRDTHGDPSRVGEAAVLRGEAMQRAVGDVHALAAEELVDLGEP